MFKKFMLVTRSLLMHCGVLILKGWFLLHLLNLTSNYKSMVVVISRPISLLTYKMRKVMKWIGWINVLRMQLGMQIFLLGNNTITKRSMEEKIVGMRR
ncbi:hypothetical protein RDI58_007469 [Solanum bulbocastanum]|uniref:Uncharacterized protein n=1 Tax=Solanum bulbocastanum TaxID=147425 RepID=A0AAN8U0X9_SOLBU